MKINQDISNVHLEIILTAEEVVKVLRGASVDGEVKNGWGVTLKLEPLTSESVRSRMFHQGLARV
jgi:hypothetical protein